MDDRERRLAAQLATIDADHVGLQVAASRTAANRAVHDATVFRSLRTLGVPRLVAAAVTVARAHADHVCHAHDAGCFRADD